MLLFWLVTVTILVILKPDRPGWHSYSTAMHGRRQLNAYMAYASYLDITSAANFLKILQTMNKRERKFSTLVANQVDSRVLNLLS